MNKHVCEWEVSCFDCPSCGGLLKYCSSKINKNKFCSKYKCFNKDFCWDRDYPRAKKNVFYKLIRNDLNSLEFERV